MDGSFIIGFVAGLIGGILAQVIVYQASWKHRAKKAAEKEIWS